MNLNIKWRLSVMMLLEYAIWGAWAPVLSAYLSNPPSKGGLGFDNAQLGVIYSLLPLASIISPFIAGQLADRQFATERFLGTLQLLGGAALLVMASQKQYGGMILWMMIFSLLYAPTLALTNSLAFSHMRNSEKEFGGIRVWGTIGWIVSGLLLTLFRNRFPHLTPQGMSDSLFLAGIMALLLGIFSFSLPHTPPKREGVNPWAFLDALQLLENRNFAVFVIISFVVATELQFYYVLTAPFLEKRIGIPGADVPGVMTLAQIAEIVVMGVLLPFLLPKMGVRKTMVVGILAWPIRYIIFALGAAMPQLKWLVVASLTLHGFCYVFFFTVGFIYVDQVAHADIRASAQSLIALVVLGIGSYVGSYFTGWIGNVFTDPVTKTTNWTGVFLVPCGLTIVCAIVFPLLFRESRARLDVAAEA
ncbi:MAG: MFS transporter [Chthonomonadales bacterium]